MESTSLRGVDLAPRLRMAVMRLARRLRQQAEGDVSASQLSALASLDQGGPMALGELAVVERVQPPTITKIVARLEELGFVVREPDPADRRVARVRVSEAGRRYVEDNRSRKDAYLARRLESFAPDEAELLERALDLLERLVEDAGGPGPVPP